MYIYVFVRPSVSLMLTNYKLTVHRDLDHSVFVSLPEELFLFRFCTVLPLICGIT